MVDAPLIVILGPTASGKTALAVSVAHLINGEIISADSRQVYTGMDVGTGKDISAYNYMGCSIPYHLIDIVPAGDKYNVHRFKQDFELVYSDIRSRGKIPILCGGTGLYIKQILQPDPYTAVPVDLALRESLATLTREELVSRVAGISHIEMKVDTSSTKRMIRAVEISEFLRTSALPVTKNIRYDASVYGLQLERPVLRAQIAHRLDARLNAGMIEEAKVLLTSNVSTQMLEYYGLEYRFLSDHLSGKISYLEMKERLFTAICQYAKRQETFFRKMEKDGIKINWLNASNGRDILLTTIMDHINSHLKLI